MEMHFDFQRRLVAKSAPWHCLATLLRHFDRHVAPLQAELLHDESLGSSSHGYDFCFASPGHLEIHREIFLWKLRGWGRLLLPGP